MNPPLIRGPKNLILAEWNDLERTALPWKITVTWAMDMLTLTKTTFGGTIQVLIPGYKLRIFGGAARQYAISFSTGTKAYIGTGIDGAGFMKDLWMYDPAVYHYSWSTGDTIPTINATTTGTYKVTVTDTSGCTATDSASVLVKQSSTSSEETITRCGSYTWNGTEYFSSGNDTFHTTNAGGCDSMAILHLFISSADTLSQTINTCKGYTWNGFTYRKSGVYYYRYSSGNCKLVAVLNLNIPRLASTVSMTPPLCHNSFNGSITVTANGVSPFLYKNGLNGNYQPSGTFTGLLGNTYRVYFQDANGCEGFTDSISLPNPIPTSASYTTTSPACYNTATATITVNASGGTSPYKYKNGASGTYQSSNIFTGLRAGVQYRIYVQDANGCNGNTSLITIAQTAAIAATFTVTNATCANTANGSVTVTATGGTPPYKYKNGASGNYQSSNTIIGLRAGVQYRIYVQDNNGCIGNTTLLTVSEPCSTYISYYYDSTHLYGFSFWICYYTGYQWSSAIHV